MKLHALLILTAVLFASSINNVSIAQVQDSTAKTNLPGNAFYFYFINGYALAYKFYNSGNSDLRLRIDLASSYSDSKINQDNNSTSSTSTPSTTKQEDNNTNSINGVTAEFAYSYNFYRSHLGQAYAGIGPFISYNRSKQDYSNNYNDSPIFTHKGTNSILNYGFSAGLSAFIGLEAFLNQSLRVFAETQLTGGRNWSKTETHNEDIISPDFTRHTSTTSGTIGTWSYNLTSARIGLGISI